VKISLWAARGLVIGRRGGGGKIFKLFIPCILNQGDRGSTVVKVLYYKSEGRWFDRSWCQWKDIKSFRSYYGPGIDSASNRNEYQAHLLGVKAAGA